MAASSSSDSDSSSSRSTSPEPDNKQKQTMKGQAKSKEEVEESSSSDSDSDSDESSSEMDTTEDANETKAPAKKVVIVGTKPYKPPSGFNSVNQQAPPSSSSSSVLSNLDGKRVIHITAPSFLPLSKVKEITMSKIMKGKPILSYEGADYGIPSEAFGEEDLQGKSLLVFDKTTKQYKKTTDHIPTYNIQELMNVPEADKAAVEALRDTVKPARPQPKNLKMRFRPLGSLPTPPETLGSDSESDAEPTFKVPTGEKERKRKHDHTEGEASQTASSPSRKKSKKHSAPEDGEEKSHKKSKKSKDGEEKKRKKSTKA